MRNRLLSLHSMEMNSQLYEDWRALDMERCHVRKTLCPGTDATHQRTATIQNGNHYQAGRTTPPSRYNHHPHKLVRSESSSGNKESQCLSNKIK